MLRLFSKNWNIRKNHEIWNPCFKFPNILIRILKIKVRAIFWGQNNSWSFVIISIFLRFDDLQKNFKVKFHPVPPPPSPNLFHFRKAFFLFSFIWGMFRRVSSIIIFYKHFTIFSYIVNQKISQKHFLQNMATCFRIEHI